MSLEQWRSEAPERRAKSERILSRLRPIRRDKPRDPVEARFLRSVGTPEHKIGPVRRGSSAR
jgi:hypothetical protein